MNSMSFSAKSLLTLLCTASWSCRATDAVDTPPPDTLTPVFNRIVFESNRDDPNGDLYIMNTDGSNVQRLASSGFADGCPSVSPDGKRIAFYSTRLGNQRSLYVMRADGTSIRFVDGPVRNSECAHWSADASKIGYVRDDRSASTPQGVLRIANADGSGVKTLDSAAAFVGPALSPDGDRVVYARYDGAGDAAKSGVFVTPTAGGSSNRIAPGILPYREDATVDWSRDGLWVLYDCTVTPPFGQGVCISRPDGLARESIPYPFTGGNFQDAKFSPDALFLVSANLDVSITPRAGSPRIYLHDGVTPSWLSDGSGVGFVSPPKFPDPEPYNPADIFVGNKDGTGVRNLTKHPAIDIHPSWSPIR